MAAEGLELMRAYTSLVRASTRPRRDGRGRAPCAHRPGHGPGRFNEAAARWPRKAAKPLNTLESPATLQRGRGAMAAEGMLEPFMARNRP